MLNKNQLEFIPDRIYQRLNNINTEYLVSIGELLKIAGELRPSDIHVLQQSYNIGAQTDKMAKMLSEVSQKNIDDIYKLFDAVAKENYKFAKPFYEAKLIDYIPYEENIPLQRKVKAMIKQTVDECTNLSQHTAFSIFSKDGKSLAPLYEKNANKIATSLSDTYTKIVDYAVTQVNMGMESYTKAVNDIVKAMSASGIRTVDYATGYSRRLDSAVRQNVLWGVKECNQQTANLVGEEFGADGMEVDYHSYPRPSHEIISGRQFALGKARTVNGTYYPSFEEVAKPLLDEYGCLHFSFAILLGVSRPAYTEEELREYAKADKATFKFEGRKYTLYEGTQLQRKVETALRQQRDILNMAKAAGTSETELIARGKIRMLTDKYVELSKASGLPTQMERVKSAVKVVDKSRGNGIIEVNKTQHNGRYKWSQEKIDEILSSDLKNLDFTLKPTYNPRIRANGKTTIAEDRNRKVLYIEKVEIGQQDSHSVEFLTDTIIHEELEARIALKSVHSSKYKDLYYGEDANKHKYIHKVIDKYFKMKGWWHDEGK